MKRPSFTDVYTLFLSDPVAAKIILSKDIIGYIKEAEDINKLLEMLTLDEKIEFFKELNNAGAGLDINELLREVEPYTALRNFYDFVDNGADINKLAEKVLKDENIDIFFEGDIIDELLEDGMDAGRLFDLCHPAIEQNEDALEVNEFIERFRGYLPNEKLKQYLK